MCIDTKAPNQQVRYLGPFGCSHCEGLNHSRNQKPGTYEFPCNYVANVIGFNHGFSSWCGFGFSNQVPIPGVSTRHSRGNPSSHSFRSPFQDPVVVRIACHAWSTPGYLRGCFCCERSLSFLSVACKRNEAWTRWSLCSSGVVAEWYFDRGIVGLVWNGTWICLKVRGPRKRLACRFFSLVANKTNNDFKSSSDVFLERQGEAVSQMPFTECGSFE